MESKRHDDSDKIPRLELLLKDYSLVREDERTTGTEIVATIGAVLTAVLAAMVFISDNELDSSHGKGILFWATVFAPTVLLLPAIYAATTGAERTIRSFYLRALEREIHTEMQALQKILRDPQKPWKISSYPSLRIFSFKELITSRLSTGRLNGGGIFLLSLVSLSFSASLFILVKKSYENLLQINDALAAAAVIIYIAIAIGAGHLTYRTSLAGREYFRETVKIAGKRFYDTLTPKEFLCTDNSAHEPNFRNFPKSTPDSLGLFPKPEDLPKQLNSVGGTLVAGYMIYSDFSSRVQNENLLLLLLGILFFETFVYQTRYLINDLVGIKEERLLKSRQHRGRIVDQEAHVIAAVRSLIARSLVILVVVACMLVTKVGCSLLAAIVALSILTILYETLRRKTATKADKPRVQAIYAILIFIFVSFGIPLRFAFGFFFYAELSLHDPSVFLAWLGESLGTLYWFLLWCFAYSLSSVTPTWALECLAEATSLEEGKIHFLWKAEGKRHTWFALWGLCLPLGIQPINSQKPIEANLLDHELSGHECWTLSPQKERKRIHRSFRWAVAPWTLAAIVSSFAAVGSLSSLFKLNIPLPVAGAALVFHIVSFILAQDLTVTAKSGLTAPPLLFLAPAISTGILLWFHITDSRFPTLALVSYVLLFLSGPLWVNQLRGRYSDTRHQLAKAIKRLARIDSIIACRIIKRVGR